MPAPIISRVRGAVFAEGEVLDAYSVDAGPYCVRPEMVVFPEDEQDVLAAVRDALRRHIPVVARGGGTGLAGGSVGRGMVVDLRNLDRIRVSGSTVEADAGVTRGCLDAVLEQHGKFLGPNPSVGPYCTVGGMVATNAAGSRTLKYGAMIDSLLEVRMVSGRGEIVALPSDTTLSSLVEEIARGTDLNAFPHVSKNSSGYRLDRALAACDCHRVVAGSEGTLGIVTRARLAVHDLPERRTLRIVAYRSRAAAARGCRAIVVSEPSAVEIADAEIIKDAGVVLPDDAKCVLMVEHENMDGVVNLAKGRLVLKTDRLDEARQWWLRRGRALAQSMRHLADEGQVLQAVEDAVVPADQLEQLFGMVDRLTAEFGTKAVVYGHAGDANVHLRVALCKGRSARKAASRYLGEVVRARGSISGEHGDGIMRAEFVRMQYGRRNMAQFQKLKDLFDPRCVMNPGKILPQRAMGSSTSRSC